MIDACMHACADVHSVCVCVCLCVCVCFMPGASAASAARVYSSNSPDPRASRMTLPGLSVLDNVTALVNEDQRCGVCTDLAARQTDRQDMSNRCCTATCVQCF